jgi:hypothetical protein
VEISNLTTPKIDKNVHFAEYFQSCHPVFFNLWLCEVNSGFKCSLFPSVQLNLLSSFIMQTWTGKENFTPKEKASSCSAKFLVTAEGVWIGNLIHGAHTSRNCKQLGCNAAQCATAHLLPLLSLLSLHRVQSYRVPAGQSASLSSSQAIILLSISWK